MSLFQNDFSVFFIFKYIIYRKSRIELKQLDELMATRMKDIQKLNKQRLRQMKELQNTMESLTRFHVEYWKANERRKQIRPMIEKYEEDQIIEMTSNKFISIKLLSISTT